MITLCREQGIPAPKFEERGGGLAVTFKFKKPISASSSPAYKKEDKPLSVRQKMILDIIKQYENVGIKQIMTELINPPSQRTVQRDLELLETRGYVSHFGSSQATVWGLK